MTFQIFTQTLDKTLFMNTLWYFHIPEKPELIFIIMGYVREEGEKICLSPYDIPLSSLKWGFFARNDRANKKNSWSSFHHRIIM